MKQTKTTATTTTTTKIARPAGMGSLFGKANLTWMLIGVVVIALGVILMSGGGSSDPNVFNKDEVYGTRRITIAPLVILAGLVIMIIAIFRQPKNAE